MNKDRIWLQTQSLTSISLLTCPSSIFCLQRVLSHQDDTALLKAYIVEWRKFFTQCDILPKPFCQLEITLMGKQGSNKKTNMEDSIVRKVRGGNGKTTKSFVFEG